MSMKTKYLAPEGLFKDCVVLAQKAQSKAHTVLIQMKVLTIILIVIKIVQVRIAKNEALKKLIKTKDCLFNSKYISE